MKNVLFLLFAIYFLGACKREPDMVPDDGSNDSTFPVVTLNSPDESSVYQNGDTVFITGTVTDNELHGGTILLKNDTSLTEYLNQYHNVHELSDAPVNFMYVVSGITQNEAVTLTVSYEDHHPNTTVITRHLTFIP